MTAYNPHASCHHYCCDNRTISDPIASYLLATVAALRAMSASNVTANEVAQTLGQFSAGDGGGNLYYWNATSVEVDNGSTIIQATGTAVGRWMAITTSIASYVVENISDLRAMTTSLVQENEVAQTLGYYAAGDGGGNQFYWNTTEVTVDNSGTIIKAADRATGRWMAVDPFDLNVRKFGAKGDGIFNDRTSVIGAEVAAGALGGGVVFFPIGRYNLPGHFYFTNPYVTWRGGTPGPYYLTSDPSTVTQASILLITGTAAEFLFVAAWGRTFEDLAFVYPDQIPGDSVDPIVPVVYPYTLRIEVGNCAVRRCTFYNSYDAIRIRNGLYRIEDCLVFGIHNDVYLDRAGDIGWISKINGGTGYIPPPADGSEGIGAWMMSNKTSWDVRRADGFRLQNIQLGVCNVALKFAENNTPGDAPVNGSAYGSIVGLDIDKANHGILASSTRADGGGVHITNFNIGPGPGGEGSAITLTAPTGGGQIPIVTMMNGSIRGTWALGEFTSPQTLAAGMLYLTECRGPNGGTLNYPAPVIWTAPTLLNSWVNFGGGGNYRPAGYRKDAGGLVWLGGKIKDGTLTDGTTLFVLPVGYRPPAEVALIVSYYNADGSQVLLGNINIDADGNVKIYEVSAARGISLDGLSFSTS